MSNGVITFATPPTSVNLSHEYPTVNDTVQSSGNDDLVLKRGPTEMVRLTTAGVSFNDQILTDVNEVQSEPPNDLTVGKSGFTTTVWRDTDITHNAGRTVVTGFIQHGTRVRYQFGAPADTNQHVDIPVFKSNNIDLVTVHVKFTTCATNGSATAYYQSIYNGLLFNVNTVFTQVERMDFGNSDVYVHYIAATGSTGTLRVEFLADQGFTPAFNTIQLMDVTVQSNNTAVSFGNATKFDTGIRVLLLINPVCSRTSNLIGFG